MEVRVGCISSFAITGMLSSLMRVTELKLCLEFCGLSVSCLGGRPLRGPGSFGMNDVSAMTLYFRSRLYI